MIIRLAHPDDAAALQEIYAPIVRDTAISFEMDVPPVEEMIGRVSAILTRYPWLVATEGDHVMGYAYASRHRERAAYQWAVDVSCYLHADWRGKGVGKRLYQALFTLLRLQGFYQVFAGIALPNPGSVALHESMGMQVLGIYRHVGYKQGAWHDVGWWQGTLSALPEHPLPPRPLPILLAKEPERVRMALTPPAK